MITKKSTGKFDINSNEIFEGDNVKYKDIEGNKNVFTIKWSNYWRDFIGDCGEIYDLSSSYFCKTTKIS